MDSCRSTNVKNSVEKMTALMDGVSGLEIDNDTRESSLWMKKLTDLKRQLNMLLEVFQYFHRTGKWNNMEASNLWSLRVRQVESAAESIVHGLEEEEGPVPGARATASTMSAEDMKHSEDRIGQGAFGQVYLIDHLGVNAAAKIINLGYPDDEEFNKRHQLISEEYSTMRKLQGSPHVVTLVGDILHDKTHIIIFTEFLPGGDLRTLLDEAMAAGFMEELQKSAIMDVVAGMKYIHANNVIHGDLKAKNILMDSHGRAKVADLDSQTWLQC
ncbi:unnamed protein product [Choristocarpus tenellus]